MTPKEALDQAAIERGYRDWNDIFAAYQAEELLTNVFEDRITRALDIMWNAAIDAAANDVEWIEFDRNVQVAESILKLKR